MFRSCLFPWTRKRASNLITRTTHSQHSFPSPRGCAGFVLNSILITRLRHFVYRKWTVMGFYISIAYLSLWKIVHIHRGTAWGDPRQRGGKWLGQRSRSMLFWVLCFLGSLYLCLNISGSRKGVKALPVLSPMQKVESLLSFLLCSSHWGWCGKHKGFLNPECSTCSCEALLLSCVGKVALSLQWLWPFHIRNEVGRLK